MPSYGRTSTVRSHRRGGSTRSRSRLASWLIAASAVLLATAGLGGVYGYTVRTNCTGHATANIVVMRMVLYPSPYVEDPTGAHENLLVLTGSGPAMVFRNGAVIDGAWQRPNLSDQTELVDSAGHTIALAPGQTWIELVPTTVNVMVSP